jgi:hypothetical protein
MGLTKMVKLPKTFLIGLVATMGAIILIAFTWYEQYLAIQQEKTKIQANVKRMAIEKRVRFEEEQRRQRMQQFQMNLEAVKKKEQSILEEQEAQRIIAEHKPPEIRRLTKLLNDFVQNPQQNWDKVVAIGDIYRKGAYPRFLPNEDLAMECYKIAAACPDGETAGMAQTKYIEVRTEPIADDDKAGTQLPTEYGYRACRLAEKEIRLTPFSMFQKPKYKKSRDFSYEDVNTRTQFLPENDADLLPFMDILELNRNQRQSELQTAMTGITPVTRSTHQTPAYTSDSQNVHDHSVVRAIKHNLSNLKRAHTVDRKTKDVKEEVRNAILIQNDLSEEEKYNALQVVDNLSLTNHSVFGESEADVLRIVWSRINAAQDPQEKENLTEMLGKQLASGIENGHVVCSTGKISRLMGTFDGLTESSELETAKPMWAVKEEIANLAATVRKKHLEQLTQSQRDMFERGEDFSGIEERMKRDFEATATEQYVQKLGMSKKVVEPIVQMYMEGF